MRFLIDTNILLHVVNTDSPDHRKAHDFLQSQLDAGAPWCTSWPILYEFLRVATHRRVFATPLKPRDALEFIARAVVREEVAILTATGRHFEVLGQVVAELSHPAANLFHDIHTATLMREHGVREIVTADTDFLQFRFLKVTNPLRP
ncbi:MAG TPA: TA system VapC family ribonuclease toxin [Bryobacteraceae bacterium]